MKQYNEAFVGIDTAKNKHAVAIADAGGEGELRYLGEIDSAPAAVERMIRKLAGRYKRLHFCYEAGPTGYGLYASCALSVTTASWSRPRWCRSDRDQAIGVMPRRWPGCCVPVI